jgi:hypothetical protein
VRTGQSTAGAAGTLTTTVAGTSVVTLAASPTPNDDYEIAARVVTGGTRGTAGITYQLSLDGGRNWGAVTALGTAIAITVPGAGGVTFNIAAGTLLAGDTWSVRTTAPQWSASELGTALDALRDSILDWELVSIVGALDATSFDTVELKIASMSAAGKYRAWIGHTRMPNAGESEAAYKTALDGIFASKATIYGMLCAGACKMVSSVVSGRRYKRPISYVVGAQQAAFDHEENIAEVRRGPISGISIRDANGNADEHDEAINPGLDDSRFTTLRTIEGKAGVYVNRGLVFSSPGSDFVLFAHRRVMGLALRTLRAFFVERLNSSVRVNATTGYILEEDALEIERGAEAALRAVLLAKPKASAVAFSLSRTDNLLSTKTLTGSARVIPLAYAEQINLDVGFYNPALAIQTNG